MKLPFTREEFLQVFRDYNLSVWPVQVIFYLFAVAGVIFVLKRTRKISYWISLFLSFLWVWMGVVYHYLFFSDINKAARVFAVFFILEGILFLGTTIRKKTIFIFEHNLFGFTGLGLIFIALLIYPLLGLLAGHVYPDSPTFGLPCPTTIYSLGFILLGINTLPGYLYIIPVIWSLIGTSAAFSLGIIEDLSLGISGLISLILYFFHRRKRKENTLW